MKMLLALPFAVAMSTVETSPLTGGSFEISCTSDRDGSEVLLSREDDSDTGYIHTENIDGEAAIYPGVNSLTFVYIGEEDVMTFVVHFDTHDYDLSIRGPHAGNDHGTCNT